VRVAVLDDYQAAARAMADWDRLPDAEVVCFHDHVADPGDLVARLRGFDVVVAMRERTPFPRATLERLRDLRLLITTGPFNAAIDVGAAAELGITVCGTLGPLHNTAELTWALILAVARDLPAEDALLRAGGWQRGVGRMLHGATLSVLGLGHLGAQVARVGLAFGMDVVAWSANLTAARCDDLGVSLVERDELFRRADVLTVHLRLSDRTEGLVGARELALMAPTAVLVNTSRGPIVDELALAEALTAGRLGGAGLDVFSVEPLPLDHPLRRAPNTVLSPHLGYVTEDAYRTFYGDAVEDIEAFAAGAPVRVIASPGD
jgi:phosphoglycerate dehydrogenase-like enzyme